MTLCLKFGTLSEGEYKSRFFLDETASDQHGIGGCCGELRGSGGSMAACA
jgi:hypothetical protein